VTPTIAEVREALLNFGGMARSTMAARLDPDSMVIVTRDSLAETLCRMDCIHAPGHADYHAKKADAILAALREAQR
jgi:hypothetical protein